MVVASFKFLFLSVQESPRLLVSVAPGPCPVSVIYIFRECKSQQMSYLSSRWEDGKALPRLSQLKILALIWWELTGGCSREREWENSGTAWNIHVSYISFQNVDTCTVVCLREGILQCEAGVSVIIQDTNYGKLQGRREHSRNDRKKPQGRDKIWVQAWGKKCDIVRMSVSLWSSTFI